MEESKGFQSFYCYEHGFTSNKCDCFNQVQKAVEERRCENCWYCYISSYLECRFNAPESRDELIYVAPKQWCGKFYPKDLPPPWKPRLIHKQG
jgi:hypothetical protein